MTTSKTWWIWQEDNLQQAHSNVEDWKSTTNWSGHHRFTEWSGEGGVRCDERNELLQEVNEILNESKQPLKHVQRIAEVNPGNS